MGSPGLLTLMLIGASIGLAKSIAPLGPTGVLIVRRGAERRYLNGMAIAAGGTTAETCYCFAAVLGLNALAAVYPQIFTALRGVGIAIMFGVGLFVFSQPPRPPAVDPDEVRTWKTDILVGLSATGMNPTLLVTWSVAVGLLQSVLGVRFDGVKQLAFPLAVACGTMTSNALLMLAMRRWHARMSERSLRMIVRALGILLIGIATWQLVSTLRGPRVPAPASAFR